MIPEAELWSQSNLTMYMFLEALERMAEKWESHLVSLWKETPKKVSCCTSGITVRVMKRNRGKDVTTPFPGLFQKFPNHFRFFQINFRFSKSISEVAKSFQMFPNHFRFSKSFQKIFQKILQKSPWSGHRRGENSELIIFFLSSLK